MKKKKLKCYMLYGVSLLAFIIKTQFSRHLQVYLIWAYYIFVRVEVPVSKLPQSMDKLRVALLSDIHLGPTVGFNALNRIVGITNDLKPGVQFTLSSVMIQKNSIKIIDIIF